MDDAELVHAADDMWALVDDILYGHADLEDVREPHRRLGIALIATMERRPTP